MQRNVIAPLCAAVCLITWAGCSAPPPPEETQPDAGGPATPAGPVARISPDAVVEFGQVAFFTGRATQEPVLRKVVVFNTGDEPLRVEPQLDPGTAPEGELELQLPDGWTPEQKVEAKAGSNFFELALRLTPKSLGQRVWHLRIHTNDPRHAETTLEVRASIVAPPPCQYQVTPTQFNFGAISPPDYRDLPIRISNLGSAQVEQCLVSEVELVAPEGTPVKLLGGPITDRVIRPGESLEVMLRILAIRESSSAEYQAELRVHLAPSDSPLVTVPISVSIAESDCLVVAPADLDFGTVGQGCSSATRTFNVYNTCTETVILKEISLSGCAGSTPCPEFTLVQTPSIPPGGLPIAPGTVTVPFQVKFKPHISGPVEGSVLLTAGDPGAEQTWVVGLKGVGDPPTTQVDTFQQETQPKADILFVLDNSPSMATHQASVASNLASFLQYIETSGVDFHLAVITADSALGAGFLSGPSDPDTVLTSSSTNLDSQFAAKVNVGSSGSGSPKCLEQALAALTAPLVTSQNTGFLRSDAALSVLCITDTTDNSPRSVSDYVSDLQALKSSASALSFSAVGGFTQACPGDTGGRLADAVTQTNGLTADLCDASWHTTFEALGRAAFGGLRSSFFLTATPDLTVSPLQVDVDGQPVASTTPSGSAVWTYDPVGNALNFEPMYVPGSGQTVTVTYARACYP